jgi:hypothetical protein
MTLPSTESVPSKMASELPTSDAVLAGLKAVEETIQNRVESGQELINERHEPEQALAATFTKLLSEEDKKTVKEAKQKLRDIARKSVSLVRQPELRPLPVPQSGGGGFTYVLRTPPYDFPWNFMRKCCISQQIPCFGSLKSLQCSWCIPKC